MSLRLFRIPPPAALIVTAILFVCCPALRAVSWKEIPPEDLAATAPAVDPDASVEILFKEMKFDNSDIESGSLHTIYVRLKIFTEKGVDELRTIPLIYRDGNRVTMLAARVVKPDGTTVEIGRDAFFDTEIERSRVRRVYRKAFAPPGLAVGDIVEYQATFDSRGVYGSIFVFFQERWPAQKVTIRITPIEFPGIRSRTITFKIDKEEGGVDSNGIFTYHLKNIPGARKEPFQPPQSVVAPWLLFLQTEPGETADDFWRRYGRELYKGSNRLIQPRKPVAAKAAELTAAAASPEDKLRALFDYCRNDIINSRHDPEHRLSPEQIKAINDKNQPDQVIDRGYGNPANIRNLFASLAIASGFDARTASACDRTEFYFDKMIHSGRVVPDALVAVRSADEWLFLNPGSPYYPFGALPWKNEGVDAIIADKREALFARTARPQLDFSTEKRTARLSLAEDGTLSGTVIFDYGGHCGIELKEQLDEASPAEREKFVRELLKDRIPNVEISDLVVTHADSKDLPLQIAMKVTAPAYAERLGDRLFVQPNVFERGAQPLFPAVERVFDLVFPYPLTEEEDVELTLPEGYRLEEASAPHSFDQSPFLKYDAKLEVRGPNSPAPMLRYTRRLFCLGSPVKARFYRTIREMFDNVHRQDQHTLTLKRKAAD